MPLTSHRFVNIVPSIIGSVQILGQYFEIESLGATLPGEYTEAEPVAGVRNEAALITGVWGRNYQTKKLKSFIYLIVSVACNFARI